MTDKNKTNSKPDYYALAETQPDKYRILESGAVYGSDEGHIVAMDSSRNPNAITKDNTQEMHKLRREHTRESITSAIIEGTEAIDLSQGVKLLSLPLVDIVKKGGNRSVEAYKALLQGAGLAFDNRTQDTPTNGIKLTLEATTEALAAAFEAMKQRDSSNQDSDDVVDGQVTDV